MYQLVSFKPLEYLCDMRAKTVGRDAIKTASRLFYKQGFNSTGINQIIDEAGVSKTSLYQNFRTKEDLLEAYLRTTAVETEAALRAAADKHKTPRTKILGIFSFLMDVARQKEYYGCNFQNIISELPVDEQQVRGVIRAQKDSVRGLFREILAPAKMQHLADRLYVVFEGALIANKIQGEIWPIEAAREVAAALLPK